MSYDISLIDPVTHETIEIDDAHFMRGGTYAVGGTHELWLNITYNYSRYYYDATEGDERFAHDEVSCYYTDGTTGPVVTEYGIRGIYGKTGAESIPMLEDMIHRIESNYRLAGKWATREERRKVYRNIDGRVINAYDAITGKVKSTSEEVVVKIDEGDTSDYWETTAANAIRPLHQLIAFAKMRPDGIWDGD